MTLYFNSTAGANDNSWSNSSNWWEDENASIPHSAIPESTDIIRISENQSCILDVSFTIDGDLRNNGQFFIQSPLTNNGTINNLNGQMYIQSTLNSIGTINNNSDIFIQSACSLTIESDLNNTSGTITNSGTFTINGTFNDSGNYQSSSNSTLNGNGTYNRSGGSLDFSEINAGTNVIFPTTGIINWW